MFGQIGEAIQLFTIAMSIGVIGLGVWKVISYVRADSQTKESTRQAWHIRRRWHREARMIGLTATDKTPTLADRFREDGKKIQNANRLRYPTLRCRSDRYGVVITTKTLPGLGLTEWQQRAAHLADAWGCTRVAITKSAPGRLRIRAVRLDPLTEPTAWVPDGQPPADLRRVVFGVDEYAEPVPLRLDGVPGIGVFGLPGYGKTSFILGLICRLVASPAVQFAFIDGKGGADYEDLAPRAFLFAGDDLEQANAAFKRLVELREQRSNLIRAALGVKNFWQAGPTPDWPLVVVVVDEAHTYFAEYKGSDPETRRLAALAAENKRLVEDLVKKGRSVGLLVILATQKGTGDAIPTSIRDVCPVSLAFACRTDEAAVAALGADIRNWLEANPVALQDPAYIGVASMVVQGRPGFTRVRVPLVDDADAAALCAATAELTADPAALLHRGLSVVSSATLAG